MTQELQSVGDLARLEMEAMIGFNGGVNNGLIIHPDGQHMIYPLGITIVIEHLTTQEQHFLMGHSHNVSCVAVSKSGKYIASGQITHMGFVADIIVWDYNTMEAYARFKLHKVKVESLAFSPNDKYLVTLGGEDDGKVVVWDLKGQKAICGANAQLESAGNTYCVAFHQTDDNIFVTGGKNTLRVWELSVESRKILPTDVTMGQMIRHVTSIQMTEQYILCGTSTGDIIGINLSTKLLQFHGPGTKEKNFSLGVTALALVKNGELLVGSGSGEIALLKVSKCKKSQTIKFDKIKSWKDENSKGLVSAVTSIALRGEGHQFYVGKGDSQIYRFNYAEFSCELVKSCHSMEITDVIFPFGMKDLIITSQESQIRIWNLKTRKELLRQVVPNKTCKSLAITRDGKLIISAWNDGKIRGFGFNGGKLCEKFTRNEAHCNGVTAVAVTSDGRHIISGGGEGQVRIWTIEEGDCNGKERTIVKLKETMMEHKGLVSDIKITKDDRKCVSSSTDGTTIIWNIERMNKDVVMKGTTAFTCANFGVGEHHIVTSGINGNLVFWDVHTALCARELHASDKPITCSDISADGTVIVTGGEDQMIKVSDYFKGEVIAATRCFGTASTVRLDSEKRFVVCGNTHGAILVWKLSACLDKSGTEYQQRV